MAAARAVMSPTGRRRPRGDLLGRGRSEAQQGSAARGGRGRRPRRGRVPDRSTSGRAGCSGRPAGVPHAPDGGKRTRSMNSPTPAAAARGSVMASSSCPPCSSPASASALCNRSVAASTPVALAVRPARSHHRRRGRSHRSGQRPVVRRGDQVDGRPQQRALDDAVAVEVLRQPVPVEVGETGPAPRCTSTARGLGLWTCRRWSSTACRGSF